MSAPNKFEFKQSNKTYVIDLDKIHPNLVWADHGIKPVVFERESKFEDIKLGVLIKVQSKQNPRRWVTGRVAVIDWNFLGSSIEIDVLQSNEFVFNTSTTCVTFYESEFDGVFDSLYLNDEGDWHKKTISQRASLSDSAIVFTHKTAEYFVQNLEKAIYSKLISEKAKRKLTNADFAVGDLLRTQCSNNNTLRIHRCSKADKNRAEFVLVNSTLRAEDSEIGKELVYWFGVTNYTYEKFDVLLNKWVSEVEI